MHISLCMDLPHLIGCFQSAPSDRQMKSEQSIDWDTQTLQRHRLPKLMYNPTRIARDGPTCALHRRGQGLARQPVASRCGTALPPHPRLPPASNPSICPPTSMLQVLRKACMEGSHTAIMHLQGLALESISAVCSSMSQFPFSIKNLDC